MSDLVLLGFPLGRFQTNCYVVGDRAAGTCVVVDPGEGATEVVPRILQDVGLTPEAILLTHAHVDHCWSVPPLAELWDVGVHLHPEDRYLWDGPQHAYGEYGPEELVRRYGLVWEPDDDRLQEVREGQTLVRGGVSFTVRHTPGHTRGHCTYLGTGLAAASVQLAFGSPRPGDEVLLSGDLLFAGSIGRSDLVGGDERRLISEIHRAVLPLDDDTVVLPGHGPGTTVGHERRTNPFLR